MRQILKYCFKCQFVHRSGGDPGVQQAATVTQLPILADREAHSSAVAERICSAALTCFERFGVKKTTLEDIANEARCSRATVYRHFSGKDEIVLETLRLEALAFFTTLAARLETTASFEELFAEAAATSHEMVGNHRLLNVLIEVEPQLLIPHVAFGPSNIVEIATEFLVPFVSALEEGGDIGPCNSREISEWMVRTVLSFLMTPSRRFDLSDRDQAAALARRIFRPVVGHGRASGTNSRQQEAP